MNSRVQPRRRRAAIVIAFAVFASALQFVVTGMIAARVAHAASPLVGDFNGDGYEDVAVGDTTSGNYAGQVLVYYGGPSGLTTHAPQVFTPTTSGMPSQLSGCGDCAFGSALVAGNFNGDGYSDLAIGVEDLGFPSSSAPSGAVVILKGGPAGLTTQGDQFINPPSSLSSNPGFGASLASGDFNKDGFDDLAIASPYDVVVAGGTRDGAVTLMYGAADGIGPTPTVITESTPGMPGPAMHSDDGFGWELATGDFKHDGYSDLAIAAPGKAGDDILYGSSSGLTLTGAQYLQGVGPYTYQLAVGDFNGNGYDDLAVGESCGDLVEIHYGGASGLGSVAFKTAQEIKPSSRGMPAGVGKYYFGLRLAVGDIQHNGKQDLVIGNGVQNVVVWGTATKLTAKGARFVGDGPNGAIGFADTKASGYADLLDGSLYGTAQKPRTDIDVFNGSATGLGSAPAYTLSGVAPWTLSVSPGHAMANNDLLCGGP